MIHDDHAPATCSATAPLCRHGRVRARFEAEPALYEDYAKLAAWWCLEKSSPTARSTKGRSFCSSSRRSPDPTPRWSICRNTLRSMLGLTYGRQRGDHGD